MAILMLVADMLAQDAYVYACMRVGVRVKEEWSSVPYDIYCETSFIVQRFLFL